MYGVLSACYDPSSKLNTLDMCDAASIRGVIYGGMEVGPRAICEGFLEHDVK